MTDALFAEPRLARIYDALDGPRDDLDAYLALVDELGAERVLDLGCGTGNFACLLARRGHEVTGIDPAVASLDVARTKPGAEHVRWLVGDAGTLAGHDVQDQDLAIMTGNVAQVLVDDDEWAATLRATHNALRPAGRLVFEVRDPAREGWREWTAEQSRTRLDVPGTGAVETWVELTDVRLPLVSFRHTFVFESDGAVLTSDSTLRFRSRSEVEASLLATGFVVDDVRDAPDRPGRELVFVATQVPNREQRTWPDC